MSDHAIRRPVLRSLAILTLLACSTLRAQDIAGTWQGSFPSPKDQRIVIRIAKQNANQWQALIYSLDSPMAYLGRTATQISLQAGELRFNIAPIETSFQGKLNDDATTIAGTWTQSGTGHPLNLSRVTAEAAWEIPRPDAMMRKDADPDWDVVTVRPRDPNDTNGETSIRMQGHEVVLVNRTVLGLLLFSYNLHKSQIVGAPHWSETERWDVSGVPDIPGHASRAQLQILVRKMLVERFGLKLHHETKEMPVYALTVTKGGHKMARSAGDPNGPGSENESRDGGQSLMRITNATISEFAPNLAFFADRPVVDQTGLAGRYDFQLRWTFDESLAPSDGTAPPDLFSAIQTQIGLKLEPTKAPVDVLSIDAVERPPAN